MNAACSSKLNADLEPRMKKDPSFFSLRKTGYIYIFLLYIVNCKELRLARSMNCAVKAESAHETYKNERQPTCHTTLLH
jgi:hypothetical protein